MMRLLPVGAMEMCKGSMSLAKRSGTWCCTANRSSLDPDCGLYKEAEEIERFRSTITDLLVRQSSRMVLR